MERNGGQKLLTKKELLDNIISLNKSLTELNAKLKKENEDMKKKIEELDKEINLHKEVKE